MTEIFKAASSPEKTLGNERIIEICKGLGLKEDDVTIVIRILRKFRDQGMQETE